MSLLVFFHRKMQLKNLINDKNYQLMQKKQEMMDLQAYTASIADGDISYNDLSSAPASVFGRMSQYMVQSHNAATMGAQQGMAYMQAAGQMPMTSTDPQVQQQNNFLLFKNLYDQQKAQFQKAEEAVLNQKNKAMDNECLKIEQELKQLEGEYQAVSSAVEKYTKEAAPQYA